MPDVLAGWRERMDARAREALDVLGTAPGVAGIILAGSVGRGEHNAFSDIDLIPIYHDMAVAEEIAHRRDGLVELWGLSGFHTSLDVGRLAFTTEEVRAAADADPVEVIERDDRWFHTVDKAVRGRATYEAQPLLDWINAVRFSPSVRRARALRWWKVGSPRLVLLEKWGEKETSWQRSWTQFMRHAAKHGEHALAAAIEEASASRPKDVLARLDHAPEWVRIRVDLSYEARRLAGEDVSWEENARDQILVLSALYERRLAGVALPAWTQPTAEDSRARIDAILAGLHPDGW